MPSPETEGGYLVPVDCSPENIGLSGYPMSTFYANLNQIKFRSCLVVLEACFSGMTPEGSLLKRISGGAGTINSQYPMFDSEKSPLGENGTIFASATGNQVSNWYTEKGHGMFTYFFLKGLSGEADIDHNGEITVSELDQFICDPNYGVPYYSRRYGKMKQTPVTMGDKTRVIVRLK